jgi:hypothetical protein
LGEFESEIESSPGVLAVLADVEALVAAVGVELKALSRFNRETSGV